MKIKYLFLVISLWHFSLIFAGNINAHLKNGKPVNEGGVLLLNDTCIFKYNTPQSETEYNWIFKIDKADGSSYEIKKQITGQSTFTFCIDSALYKNSALGKEFKRTVLDNDSSVYYTGQVYCYLKNDLRGIFPLKINLLPSIPKFSSVKLIYDNFNEEHLSFENDTVRFTINISKTDRLLLKGGDHMRGNDYFFGVIRQYLLDRNCKNYIIDIPYFYFEDFFVLEATNSNGTVAPDDIAFIIDYIDDPEILEAIRRATDIKSTQNDSIDIHHTPQSDILQIRGELSSILECKIYDTNGKIVKSTIPSSNTIDISDLPSGIYITICTMKSNKFVIKKILK